MGLKAETEAEVHIFIKALVSKCVSYDLLSYLNHPCSGGRATVQGS